MNGQPERPVETVQEWLRYAEEDLGVAAREFEQGSTAYHTMCFLCQAAAEKLLLCSPQISDNAIGCTGRGRVRRGAVARPSR